MDKVIKNVIVKCVEMNVEPKDVNVLNLMFCVTLDVILAKLAVIIEIYQ